MDRDYNSTFSIKKAQFEGITGIEMNDIILVPKQMDTLFRIEKIKTHIDFWNLLTGTIQIEILRANNGFIQLVKNEKGKNFSISISREDLANIVGTATESLIRTLSDFKEEKLLEVKGSNITIINLEKLKKLKA
jgi:CRP-like cAMP-binding protein